MSSTRQRRRYSMTTLQLFDARSPASSLRPSTCILPTLASVEINWWNRLWRHTPIVERPSGRSTLAKPDSPKSCWSLAGMSELLTPWMDGTSRSQAIADDSLNYKMKNVLMWFGGLPLARFGVQCKTSTPLRRNPRSRLRLLETMRNTSTWSSSAEATRNNYMKEDTAASRTQRTPKHGRLWPSETYQVIQAMWTSVRTAQFFQTRMECRHRSRSQHTSTSLASRWQLLWRERVMVHTIIFPLKGVPQESEIEQKLLELIKSHYV